MKWNRERESEMKINSFTKIFILIWSKLPETLTFEKRKTVLRKREKMKRFFSLQVKNLRVGSGTNESGVWP